MLFTAAQIHEIKQIIKDYHDAFIINALGERALPEELVQRLKEKGLVDPQVNSIEDAYLYGQLLAMLENKPTADMTYPEFKKYVKKNPVPLTYAEKQAVQMAALHAGQFCQGLGNKVGAKVGSDLIEADAKLRARLETDIRTAVSENIAKRETVKQLKTDLGWATKDWARDWDRIAVTEKQTAMQEGVADGIRKDHGGEAWVSKIPQPGACDKCIDLYIGKDTHPRIFKLSTLEANGTNFGKKKPDWAAVVGVTHPNCQCTLVRVPKGWGYDEEGTLVPGGKGGKHYEDEKDVTKALRAEQNLQKAIQSNRKIVFQGFPITIEQPVGSVRKWTTPEGETGETRFNIAYGYVDGTEGMDGDEIDVFIGPDPRAENVYVIEQRNRNTGTYDEVKAMMGFSNEQEAELAYRNHYDNPDEFIICTEAMTSVHFRRWIANTKPKRGEMGKGDLRLVIPMDELLAKGGKIGGKYIRRVPYTDKNGKRRYRYFYAESSIARDVQAGETLRLGGDLIQVEKVEPNGTVHLRSGDQTLVVKGHQWPKFVSEFYGKAYYQWAEKRALQSVNAVLKHVPKELLGELKGATDKARLADLKKRVPDVYEKLKKSFARAGVNPFRAKEVIGASLERHGWEVEARAAVIGDVITKRNQDYRTTIRAAENLAGGKIVKLGHVAAVTEISRELRIPSPVPKPEPDKPPKKRKKQVREKAQAERRKDPIAEIAAKAEKEIAKLSKLLEQARSSGVADDAGAALQAALSSTAVHKLNMIAQAFPGLADKAVEPAREIMLQVPSVATVSEPKAVGSSTTVYVSGDGGQAKALSAKYKLMEADDVIASHDPRSFNRRQDYPVGVQERAYHRDKSEQAKVIRNAQRLAPQFVVNTNPDAVNGPPIMSADGVVLGGNSRTMSMQRVYVNHPEKADQLRAYLSEHAHETGFSPEDVKEFKSPILVRVIDEGGTTKEEKQLLVRQMNESFTQSMDPRTMQVAMGRKLTDQAVEALGDTMQPDETLNAFLVTNRAKPFIDELRNVGLIDQRNANQYFDKKGKMNADGKTLVSRVLVGRAIGDADLLSATKPSIIENMARAVPYMAQAQKNGKGYDLSEDLNTALDAYNSLQYRVDSGTMPALKADMPATMFDKLFSQQEMFGEAHPVTQQPRAMGLLEVLIRRPGSTQITNVFKDYAEQAAQNPEGQGGMFGAPKTPTEIFSEVAQRHLKTKEAKPPGGKEPDETAQKMFLSVEPSLVPRQPSFALDNLRKAGPFIGPRGGKWADSAHTIPWKEVKKPFLSTLILAEEAHEELNPFVSDWVFRNDGKAKTKLFEHYQKLDKATKQALDTETKYIINKIHGSDYVTVYRSMRPGDTDIGGMSVSTDKATRSGNDVRAFKVHHSDVLLHWGQEASWLSSKTYRHEKELILKKDAKPVPMDTNLKKAGGPFYGPRGGKWADAKHTIPWKEEKKRSPLHGMKIEIKPHEKMGMYPVTFFIVDEKDDKVRISRDKDGEYGPWVPKETLSHLQNDLAGKVDLPGKSKDSRINAVLEGKAEFLGKGDDGLAFRVGDKVVKVSTPIPFQPDNDAYVTPEKAVEELRAQVELGNELSDIKGIQRSEFKSGHGKGFQIKDWVEIPKKFTKEQLDSIQDTVIAIHKRGYAINDTIQPGLDKQGNPVLFDIGKVAKARGTGFHSDVESDMDNLALLYRQSGEQLVRRDVSKAKQYWQTLEGILPKLLKQGEFKFARNHLEQLVEARKKEIEALYTGKERQIELDVLDFDQDMLADDIDAAEKGITKSLSKAGPFIGPKGGKWADPQFTIPWKEGAGPRTKKQEDVPKPKRTPVGESAKKQKQGKDEAPKPKKAAPGSQLGEETLKKLVDLKCSKLPQADIPADKIKVDFSGDVNSHALVVWPDSKGAIQSGYTPEFHAKNAKEKWDRITKFRDKVPETTKAFEDKLNAAEHGSMEHQGALLGAIIAKTGLRPGSVKSARNHKHYGVVTLLPEHISVVDDKVSFDYIGKAGKRNTGTIQDETIAKHMEKYLKGKKEGESIFQSDRVIKAATKLIPKGMKLKDFRTIKATETAAKLLDAMAVPPPLTGNKSKDKLLLARAIKMASEQVSEVLNNTPSIARESYIHPDVLTYWAVNKAKADVSLLNEV